MSASIRPRVRTRLRRSETASGAPVRGWRARATAARYGSMCRCRSSSASEPSSGSTAARWRPKWARQAAIPSTVAADTGGKAALEVGDQRAADRRGDALEAALPAPLAAVRAPQRGRLNGGAEVVEDRPGGGERPAVVVGGAAAAALELPDRRVEREQVGLAELAHACCRTRSASRSSTCGPKSERALLGV